MVKGQTIPMTHDEMDALLAVSSKHLYWHALFVFAKTTGRRIGEIYNIKVGDVDFGRDIVVSHILKAKRHKILETLLVPEAKILLRRYIRDRKLGKDDYLFRERSYRQIQDRVKSFAKKAGIRHNVTFHNFRHYFITELVRKGKSYDFIQKLTGHSQLSTLQTYDHALASDIRDEAEKLIKEI